MGNLGEVDEVINNEKLTLDVGSNTYILMQDLQINIDRPIDRQITSGGNAGVPVTMNVTGGSIIQGDINGDESVNIQDIIFLINFILNVDLPDDNQFSMADMNSDGVLNIQDIILIINVILN